MGTEFPWRWGRGTISANLDVIWGMSAKTMSDIDGDAISAWLKQHQDLDVTPERAKEIAKIAFRLNSVTLDAAMAQDSLDDPAATSAPW